MKFINYTDADLIKLFEKGEIIIQIRYADYKIKGIPIEHSDYEERLIQQNDHKLLWQCPFKLRLMFLYGCISREHYVMWRKKYTNEWNEWFAYKPKEKTTFPIFT